MEQLTFVQSHPHQKFQEDGKINYSERDNYFIQCLKALEKMVDIDAHILDYKNEKILYATKGSFFDAENRLEEIQKYGFDYYDKIVIPEDVKLLAPVNAKVFDFFYSRPASDPYDGYLTYDFRIRDKHNRIVLINHKIAVLDLTDDGAIRLSLCIVSYPTNDKPGNAYIKMNNTSEVYEYIQSAGKFVEVKTQKISAKTSAVLELAGTGKTEAEIAQILNISVYTVKYHKKRIFTQTGVKNIAEAIQWMNNQKKIAQRN